jgi:6-phosphogluconolactonase
MVFREALNARRHLASPLGRLLVVFFLALTFQTARAAEGRHEYLAYVATAGKKTNGIDVYRFNADSGAITPVGLAVETPSPYSLAATRDGRYLYATNILEEYKNEKGGAISSFALDKQTGKLTLLNAVSSRGLSPAFVSLDRTERFLLVANYAGGSVAVFPVGEDGRLGEATSFVQHADSGIDASHQRRPHPHSISVSPDNRFALVADKGLDKLFVYQFNSTTGSLVPATPAYAEEKSGSGPRHFVFSPNGRFVYVVDETGSTVTVFSYNATSATLRNLQVISALPEGFAGKNTGAEVAVARSGRFLYASNRGNDTIAVFAISSRKGTLTSLEHVSTQGKTPGMFAIDPSGSYLFVANDNSDDVVVFRINQKTGRLASSGQVLKISHPACVTFVAVP